jgi:hypothetical protein
VPKGVGAGVSADGNVVTEQLLPPPELQAPRALQSNADVLFNLAPVPQAARYRLQLARDAGFGEIFDEKLSATPSIAFTDVPDGDYFVRVTAISATDFEGLPAVYPFARKLSVLTIGGVTSHLSRFRFTWRYLGGGGEARYRFQLMRERPDATPFFDHAGSARVKRRSTISNPAPIIGVSAWPRPVARNGPSRSVWS